MYHISFKVGVQNRSQLLIDWSKEDINNQL